MKFDKKALYSMSYGIYVVTSRLEKKTNGQIANTVIQVSAEPPRIAVAINKNNLTHEFIEKSGLFAVSILDESVPMQFIGLFGFKSGREIDKLSQVNYKTGVTGAPLVTDHAISLLEAKVINQVDVGTHTIFIGDVVGGEVVGNGTPLTYAAYHKKKGKTPKAAPTYKAVESDKKPEQEDKKIKRYVCNICGWIYDPAEGDPDGGIAPGTPFEEIPDDWVCPVCGASKSEFSPEETVKS